VRGSSTGLRTSWMFASTGHLKVRRQLTIWLIYCTTGPKRQMKANQCLQYNFAIAFDHVGQYVLFGRLLAFGLRDTIIRWICSFLTCRRQRVKIGKVLSEWLVLPTGMSQGSFLGPLTIFLIDDLRTNCLTHLYAVNCR